MIGPSWSRTLSLRRIDRAHRVVATSSFFLSFPLSLSPSSLSFFSSLPSWRSARVRCLSAGVVGARLNPRGGVSPRWRRLLMAARGPPDLNFLPLPRTLSLLPLRVQIRPGSSSASGPSVAADTRLVLSLVLVPRGRFCMELLLMKFVIRSFSAGFCRSL